MGSLGQSRKEDTQPAESHPEPLEREPVERAPVTPHPRYGRPLQPSARQERRSTAEPVVTAAQAVAHEALVLKLEALLSELRPLAVRHPVQPVPAALATLAEALLFDARPFVPRRRRERLPAAAPDYAGLVVQLGQALAALDVFEVRRSFWSPERAAFVWRLGAGTAPAARLRPRLAKAEADRAQADKRRDELHRMIMGRLAEAYEEGARDAQSVTPPSS